MLIDKAGRNLSNGSLYDWPLTMKKLAKCLGCSEKTLYNNRKRITLENGRRVQCLNDLLILLDEQAANHRREVLARLGLREAPDETIERITKNWREKIALSFMDA